MFRFLFIIFLIGFILTTLFGFSFFRSLRSLFYGDDAKKNGRSASSQSRNGQQSASSKRASRKKVITEDEGEYVDYEEVK